SVNGKKYILVIVDDYSRFTWVKFLRSKDEAPDFIIKFLRMIQVRLKVLVHPIRTDNSTEFVNQTLRDYCEEVGVSHETSVARSPHQNGVIERRNRTLIEAARTMLIYAQDPLFLWAQAVATAFDELRAMASEHSSSGPTLNEMTPVTISSGLVQKSYSSTPFVPPSRNDWDLQFQPMFDELLNPPPSVVHQAPKVIAPIDDVIPPVQDDSTGSPSSTTVDQDAPSVINLIQQQKYNPQLFHKRLASESALAEEPMQTTSQMEEPSHPKFDTSADDQPIVQSSLHPEWFSQPQKPPTPDHDWNKTLPVIHGSIQPWISELAKQADTRSSFNELMDTPLDFSNFIKNRLRVDTLTPELLVGPTYDLMKGSCKSLIELEYHLEEVYKATIDQLDWVNPEGQQYPHNLLQPQPLIPDNRGTNRLR
nr:putative ribonuclease H-like domain-containing protein [Tanacetum cinerariifolium]